MDANPQGSPTTSTYLAPMKSSYPLPFGSIPFFSSSFRCVSTRSITISFTVRPSTAAAIFARCIKSLGKPLKIHAPGSFVIMARKVPEPHIPSNYLLT